MKCKIDNFSVTSWRVIFVRMARSKIFLTIVICWFCARLQTCFSLTLFVSFDKMRKLTPLQFNLYYPRVCCSENPCHWCQWKPRQSISPVDTRCCFYAYKRSKRRLQRNIDVLLTFKRCCVPIGIIMVTIALSLMNKIIFLWFENLIIEGQLQCT